MKTKKKIKNDGKVEYKVVKAIVIVSKHKKMKNPTKFLTSQIKVSLKGSLEGVKIDENDIEKSKKSLFKV